MKALIITLVVFTFVGTCATQHCIGGTLLKSGLSQELQTKILELHNNMRDKVAEGIIAAQPRAQNMKEMIWNYELAAKAQAWANTCVFQHEPVRKTRRGLLYGQNISHKDKTWSSDEGEWEVLSKMITQWFEEVYDGVGGTSHFSQMVWGNTHKIGCGYSEYLQSGRTMAIFVCNYFPPGNVFGTETYTPGEKSCEKHGLSSSRSFKNLCAANDDSGSENQNFQDQRGNMGYHMSNRQGNLESYLQHVAERPATLQNSAAAFPHYVRQQPGGRQMVQTIDQNRVYGGVSPIYESQPWGIKNQYSSSNPIYPLNTGISPLLNQFSQTDLTGMIPDYQIQSSNIQNLPSNIQGLSITPGYQYLQTGSIVPPYQVSSNIQNLPSNIQGLSNIPGYQYLQTGFNGIVPPYQVSSNVQNLPSNIQGLSNTPGYQYLPTGSNGIVPPYQVSSYVQNLLSNIQGLSNIPGYQYLQTGSNGAVPPYQVSSNLQNLPSNIQGLSNTPGYQYYKRAPMALYLPIK